MINMLPEIPCLVKFSVLIPVYNSEESLPLVLEGVRQVFKENGHSYEFVLVDDGSSDNSWAKIQQQHQHGDICANRSFRLYHICTADYRVFRNHSCIYQCRRALYYEADSTSHIYALIQPQESPAQSLIPGRIAQTWRSNQAPRREIMASLPADDH